MLQLLFDKQYCLHYFPAWNSNSATPVDGAASEVTYRASC